MAFQLPATTSAPAAAGSFSFGTNAPAPAAGAAAAPAAKPAFSFGGPTGLNMGGGDADSAKAQAPPPFSGFGLSGATTAPALSLSTTLGGSNTGVTSTAAPAATAAAPAFGAGFMAQPTAAATQATAAPTTGLIGGPSLGLTTTPKSTAAPTAAVVAPLTGVVAPAVGTGGAFANLTTETKTTDSAAVSNASQLSYNQLEEHINKWTLEFEEQEKVFTEQATQINAWDKLLISNNHKIIELNDAVKKVKNDQQVLDQELEFIATQHKELEESLAPLEKEFVGLPRVDMERNQTFLMVENLDTQLKQMSEDLKEIIDNLNEASKGQDHRDPIIQIGKILNAHISSLQWIESQSNNICKKLDDIGKIHDTQKRDVFRPPLK
ncbi:nuclear pore glycoprotein p62 [Drosophila guanche]|uniref:Blast:Nuclear pore glycoprotein p62 n=1 Tax=Drosophila guanche TaxID=7266 RepID=A0A3B0JJN8_DROGU|nr:nuclear pore glycoprotein p62 [Drosophila guanche]SPP73436.1 blast:Nuclear pore glycoprotein p62 [Drosophila guanche]